MAVVPRMPTSVAVELLERDVQLAVLEEAFAQAQGGHGRLVFVSGEAGIGKSSLVRGLCARVGESARVLVGVCDGLRTPRPLGPFADIGLAVGGRLGAAISSSDAAAAVFEALVGELRSARTTVVAIENVHLADEATLDILGLLGRRVEQLGALVLATYRSDELPRTHQLRILLGDLATAPGVGRLQLEPLSPTAVAVLAEPHGIDGVELHRKTGGNPFFVTEVLLSGAAEVPATVRDAVLARTARLSEPAQDLLDVVAIVPLRRSELWLLEALVGDALATLDECVASGVLRADGEGVSFRHELARMAVEESINPHRRVELHRSVLQALRAPTGGRLDLARLAHHAEAAGDAAAVLELAPAAAKHAAAVGARREAAAQYARALRFAGGLDDEAQGDLLDRRAYACYLVGEFDVAIDAERSAVECFRRAGDRLREGDALRSLSRLLRYVGRRQHAMRVGREAVTVLEVLPAGHGLAMAYCNVSHLYMNVEDTDETLAWARRALAIADELGDVEAQVYACTNIATTAVLAGRDASEELARILEVASRSNLDEHVGRAYVALTWWSPRGRGYAAADRYLEPALEYCTERGLDLWRLYVLAVRARMQLDRGDLDGAVGSAAIVIRDPRATPMPRITALAVIGLVRARRGDPDVWPLLDEAWALAEPTGELQRVEPAAAARAEAAWLEGRAEATVEATEAALALALRRRALWVAGELAYWRRHAGVREQLPIEVPEPWEAELAGEHLRAADAGPRSTRHTRLRSRWRNLTRRNRCFAPLRRCDAWVRSLRRRWSPVASAGAASAGCLAAHGRRRPRTRPA